MKKVLVCLIFLISLLSSAQAPNISYTNQNLYLNNTTTINPTNTGGQPTYRTSVSTYAGIQSATFQDGSPSAFTWPVTTATDNTNVYVLDDYWPCIRKITPDRSTSTLAGKHVTDLFPSMGGTIIMGYADGQGSDAEFNNPKGIACDNLGNIYVADTYNHRIRKVTPTGLVTTIAGDGSIGTTNGQGILSSFSYPYSLCVDNLGNIYILDLKRDPAIAINSPVVVRKIDTNGLVATVAGSTFFSGSVDAQGVSATFNKSKGIVVDSTGNLYIADTNSYKIRKIDTTGTVTTIVNGLNMPIGITIDLQGNLYVSESGSNIINKIDRTFNVTTYSGSGYSAGTSTDNTINGLGNVASFDYPNGIAIDSNNNLFVSDRNTQRIRKVTLLTPYTISPNLPTGLVFNTETGVISGIPTSISPSTTYTITASNYSGTSTTTITLEVTATSCLSSTTWNGTTWSNGIPTINTSAIIAGNYNTATNFPGSIDCCDLIINTGSTMTVSTSEYCNVLGDITVNGTFMISAGGKLIFSSTSTSTGIVSVERKTTFMKQYDYTYWASPVSTTIGQALPSTNWEPNYTFTFNTANFLDIETSYWGTLISSNPDGQDDNGDAWTNTNITDNMISGKGYASMIKSIPAIGSYPRIETVTFTGELNTGQINIPLQVSADMSSNIDDFNLIGNPYPSAINSNDFIDANITNISGTLYFWTHMNTLTTTYSGLAMLNFSTNDYAKYTKTGGIAAVFGGKTPVNLIGSGQGFLVEAENTNNIIFTPNLMSKGYDNTTAVSFFRTINTDNKRVWISMKNDVNLYSQQLIGYNSETNLDYNKGWDSKIVNSRLILKFYSKESDTKYDIQSRGNFDVNDVVKLGYNSEIADTFTINVDSIEGIENVYIRDNGVTHELPYTFTTEIGEFNDRFELVYLNNDLGTNPINDLENLVMIPNPAKNSVEIIFKELNDEPISMYNLLGQKIEMNFKIENNKILFNVEELSNGIYLIKINNNVLKLIKK